MRTLKIRIRVTKSYQDPDIRKERTRGGSRTQGRSTQWLKRVIKIMIHKMRGTNGSSDLGKRPNGGLDQDPQVQDHIPFISKGEKGIGLHRQAQKTTKFIEEGKDQGEKYMKKGLMISMIGETGTVEGTIKSGEIETTTIEETETTVEGTITTEETETSIKELSMKEKAKDGFSIENHPGTKKFHLLKKTKRWKNRLLKSLIKSKKEQRCQQELVVFTFLHSNSKKC